MMAVASFNSPARKQKLFSNDLRSNEFDTSYLNQIMHQWYVLDK